MSLTSKSWNPREWIFSIQISHLTVTFISILSRFFCINKAHQRSQATPILQYDLIWFCNMHVPRTNLSVDNLQVKFTSSSPTLFLSHNLKSVTLATCQFFHSSKGWITFYARMYLIEPCLGWPVILLNRAKILM